MAFLFCFGQETSGRTPLRCPLPLPDLYAICRVCCGSSRLHGDVLLSRVVFAYTLL